MMRHKKNEEDMSSNIRVNKICEFCKNEFEAKKTTSKTCSDRCAKLLYKQKQTRAKVEITEKVTSIIKAQPIEELKAKEFLSIDETCKLLGISRRTLYRMFDREELKFGKAGARTLIKRSELDKLFETTKE
jgi:excisionase family DNA binding protein